MMESTLTTARMYFFCPTHWDPGGFHLVPGLTNCAWSTAGTRRPIPCFWFHLPRLFAN